MATDSVFSLNNLNALLTGASGAIGSAIARELYRHGANIVISGTKTEILEQLKNDLIQNISPLTKNDPSIHVITCDLSNTMGVENLITKAQETLGTIDILVNNAGVTRDALLMRMKNEDWDKVIHLNLSNCFKSSRAVLKNMMTKRFGRIINIASVVGVTGNPGQTNYCASKAGLIGFSKALAQEVATRNVTVNCIAPGFIDSQMTEVLKDDVKQRILSSIPMQRMGNPEEIAHAVVFLAGRGADYITGQTIHVNGGMAMI